MFKAFIGALLGATGFGTANVVIKKSLSDTSIPQVLTMSMGSGAIFLALLVGVSGLPDSMSLELIATLAGFAVIEVMLYIALYKSLESSNVTVAIAVISSYPILSTVIAILFLGETLTILQGLLSIFMILGVIVTSIDWSNFKKNGLRTGDLLKGIGWIVLCTMLHAIYFPALAKVTEDGNWQFKLLIIKLFAVLVMLFAFFVIKHNKFEFTRNKLMAGSLLGFLEVMGWVGLSWASSNSTGMIAIIIVIMQAAPLITAILAYFFLNEKLHGLQYFGVVMIVGSLAGLALA